MNCSGYYLVLNGEIQYPMMLDLRYAQIRYENMLIGIRRNLLDWTLQLVNNSFDRTIYDSERRYHISPWRNINL